MAKWLQAIRAQNISVSRIEFETFLQRCENALQTKACFSKKGSLLGKVKTMIDYWINIEIVLLAERSHVKAKLSASIPYSDIFCAGDV